MKRQALAISRLALAQMFVVVGFNGLSMLGEKRPDRRSEAAGQAGEGAFGDGPLGFAGALRLVVGDHRLQCLLQLLRGPAAAF